MANVMTDIERLTALLGDFGVIYARVDDPEDGKPEIEVRIETEEGPKNEGYMGFVCAWRFTKDGDFLRVGVWE